MAIIDLPRELSPIAQDRLARALATLLLRRLMATLASEENRR